MQFTLVSSFCTNFLRRLPEHHPDTASYNFYFIQIYTISNFSSASSGANEFKF